MNDVCRCFLVKSEQDISKLVQNWRCEEPEDLNLGQKQEMQHGLGKIGGMDMLTLTFQEGPGDGEASGMKAVDFF